MYVDDQGNQVTNTYDVSTAQMNYYYFQLSQFNQDEAEYFGVVAPFWTSKGVQKQGEDGSITGTMGAIKILCSIDPNDDVPPTTMAFMLNMLPQAFMSYVMSYSGIPAAISNALMSVSSNRYVILLIMNVFLLVMGMFLDLTPAVLIFTPIFLPITRSIGMSDVQFGIMLIMNLGIGSVTPPVGSCLFVGCGVGKVKIEGVTKYIVPLFAAMVVALFLVTFIPAIALVVPYLCGLVPSLGWTM